MKIPSQFFENIERDQLRIKAPHLLSVSGGRDSMFLLYLFHELFREGHLNHCPIVFHLHHGLRTGADLDLQLIKETTQELGMVLISRKEDVRKFSEKTGLGIEGTGRLLRYRFLAEIAAGYTGSIAVTGHHADDYIESFLMMLIRGGSRSALKTMNLISVIEGVAVYRPLLFWNRSDIDRMVKNYSIPFRDDESNLDQSFLRNRLRTNVLPLLRKEGLNPKKLWFNSHPGETRKFIGSFLIVPKHLSLDRRLFTSGIMHDIKMTLDPAFRRLGLNPVHSRMLRELCRQLDRGILNGDFRLRYEERDFLLWSARSGPVWIIRKDSGLFQKFICENTKTDIVISSGEKRVRVKYDEKIQYFVLGREEVIISWVPGAIIRIRLAGSAGFGTKKVKKLFQELRLPPPVRCNLPLIYNSKKGYITRVCGSFWEDLRDYHLE